MDVKALQDDLQSLGFTPCLANPEMGKKVGRRSGHSQNDKEKLVSVTHRRGRKSLKRRNGTGEDERQPVMARLAIW